MIKIQAEGLHGETGPLDFSMQEATIESDIRRILPCRKFMNF
jgi:hypothetical protein